MKRWMKSTGVLYRYFRGAEYPMGRIRAAWEAARMARTWPSTESPTMKRATR